MLSDARESQLAVEACLEPQQLLLSPSYPLDSRNGSQFVACLPGLPAGGRGRLSDDDLYVGNPSRTR